MSATHDFSGICDSHGLVVFKNSDSQASDVSDDFGKVNMTPGWYWASVQHGVLTGNPAGPYRSRGAACISMAYAILDHDVAD